MVFEKRRKVSLNPFSPWRSPAVSLQQTIVGRDFTIKNILDKTRRFAEGAPAKHCLLIGRRGLGKTHVLALLYHYYEKNCVIPEFESISHHVLPVILLEEERYSLNSLALFLMKIFEKFSEKAPEEERWVIPESLDSDEDVIVYCFECLKSISHSENKKIIVLCDNLEDVFKQWGEKEYKTLRAFLSDQRAIMIIGTAVRVFKEIISPMQPFYEFFERTPLVDLSDDQMLEVLKKRFIEDHLEEEFNRKEKHLKNKVAAIAKLTGGNPRLVVFLYDVVTKKNVFEIESATEELMESLNEYFRNRFSELGPQERTILDAFADMDGPATPKEISKKTRIKEHSTRTHIKRLKDAGYIDTVEYGKHKTSKYDVTERLFRLWRQTATISGRKKFQILIKFLKLYFTTEELREDFHRSMRRLDYAFRQEKLETVSETIHYLSYLQHVAKGSLRYEIFDKRTDFLFKMGDYEKVEEEILEFKSEVEIEKKNFDLKPVFKKLIETHLQQEKYVEASKDITQLIKYPISEEKEEYIETLDKIIEKCPDDDEAWFSKGRILVNAHDYKEALEYFDKACKLKPKEPRYHYGKAFTLAELNCLEEALPVIEKAIELDGNTAKYWHTKGIILGNFESHEGALQAFQRASELKSDEPEYYRLQAVALRNLNHLEKALPAIEKAIELDGNNANYWEEKGRVLGMSGKNEEVLHALQKASELKPEEPEYYRLQTFALRNLNRLEEALLAIEKAIELNENNASFWVVRGMILWDSENHEEALLAFQKASELAPEIPEYYRLRVVALRNLNRLEEALPVIEKAIELDENNANFWGEKGRILWSAKNREGSLQAFQKASELAPEEPEYYRLRAVALRNLNRLEEALPMIENAIELNENDASYWEERGRILGILEKHEEALHTFQKASKLVPEEPEYYHLQAYALRSLNRLEEALLTIEKAIELNENNASYLEEKGRILGILEKYEEALHTFQKASELKPQEPEYYRLQAVALHRLNYLEKALLAIEKAIELNENDASCWKDKGKILWYSENHEESLRAFQKASELVPEESENYLLQALALRNLNRSEEALGMIEKAIELNNKNSDYWYEKGVILAKSQKLEEALQFFQKAIELMPNESIYYYDQAIILRTLNRLEEALPVIEKAIELNDKNSDYWDEKGVILAKSQKLEEALQFFQKAIELMPNKSIYYYAQAVILRTLNRLEEALPVIEKAIELDSNNSLFWAGKATLLAESGKDKEGLECFQKYFEMNPENIEHKLRYLGFLIYAIKNLERTGIFLEEIEKAFYDQIKDNLDYFHYKSEYLILICQFEDAAPWAEQRLKRNPYDWDAKLSHLINQACLGEFGENMEGLPGKINNENLNESQIVEVSTFISRIMERCLLNGNTKTANGLYITLLKLNQWHIINQVQEAIALYLRNLVDIRDRELFVNSVVLAREHITDKDLLELIKAFLYAGRYMKEGNKVILEEVFPEIREIIFDIVEKFEEKS